MSTTTTTNDATMAEGTVAIAPQSDKLNVNTSTESIAAPSPALSPYYANLRPEDVFTKPLHMIPPDEIQQMIELQRRSIGALRATNQSFITFQEYSARAFDQITSIHSQRLTKLERLRESLTDLFVRIRQIRMQLHVRTPGLGPWVEDEEAEMAEIEDFKITLQQEEAAALAAAAAQQDAQRQAEEAKQQEDAQPKESDQSFVDADTSLPYIPSAPGSMPNSLPTSPAVQVAGAAPITTSDHVK